MANKNAKHILLIEDDPGLLEALKSALEGEGFTCTGAMNVREATFKLKNLKYACVLLDLKLGEESGEEVLNFMRTRKDLPNHQTPVLLASGHIDSETAKSLAGKIQGAVVKPFDLNALLAKVKELAGS